MTGPQADAARIVGATLVMLLAYYLAQGRPTLRARGLAGAVLALAAPLSWLLERLGSGTPTGALGLGQAWTAIGWGVAVGLATQPLLWLSSGNAENRKLRPELRVAAWTLETRAANAAAWIWFLFWYELCFRGVLLLGLAPSLGEAVSTGVVVALYALYHLHKRWDETLGSVVIGFVFAAISLRTQTFLGAFVAHALIAIGSDTWAVARRTDPAEGGVDRETTSV